MALTSLCSADPPVSASADKSVRLENPYWRLTVEPARGGRASKVEALLLGGRDLVTQWEEKKNPQSGTKEVEGGAFKGMMSGSYQSAQPQEPWRLVEAAGDRVVMEYDNPHSIFAGLRETRTVALAGRDLILTLRIENRSDEKRVYYYRIQDWLAPDRETTARYVLGGEPPIAFHQNPGEALNRHVPAPAGNWYAVMAGDGSGGLLVRSRGPVAGAYFWASGKFPGRKTLELFFPRTALEKGESAEIQVTYRQISSTRPETGNPAADALLARNGLPERPALSSPPPGHAEVAPSQPADVVEITPLHPASMELARTRAEQTGQSLIGLRLAATPGETAAFAFRITPRRKAAAGRVSFSEFRSQEGHTLPATICDSNYVAGETLILVKSRALAENPPPEIAAINNSLRDADTLEPFRLGPGQAASVWTRVTVPGSATPGIYSATGTLTFEDGSRREFVIRLKVRPFTLQKPREKSYATFFDYHLASSTPQGPNARYAISREAFVEALRFFRGVGCTGMAIYVSGREDLLWALGQCRQMGMSGRFIVMYPEGITPQDLEEAGIRALAWTIDEPGRYEKIDETVAACQAVAKKGLTPTFSANLPLGLVLADHLPAMVPIINTNGNLPYLAEATKEFKAQGREVYWYECHGLGIPTVEERALRGVYLWKEPIDGIFDWDHSSNRPKLTEHHLAGFAGTKLLPRLGLENIRQGLNDLYYLHTLEKLAERTADPLFKAEAHALLERVRADFSGDCHNVRGAAPGYDALDALRERVAGLIEKAKTAPEGETLQ